MLETVRTKSFLVYDACKTMCVGPTAGMEATKEKIEQFKTLISQELTPYASAILLDFVGLIVPLMMFCHHLMILL